MYMEPPKAAALFLSQAGPKSLLRRRTNARNVSYTPYHTGEKHTISPYEPLLIKPVISLLANAEKKPFFFVKTSLPMHILKAFGGLQNKSNTLSTSDIF